MNIHASTTTNCTFVRNSAPEGSGFGLYWAFPLTVRNSIIAFGLGGAGFSLDVGSILDLGCSDVFGNAAGDGFPPGVIDSGGNFSLNPEFCGILSSHNRELQSDSPCAPGNHPDGISCGLIGAHPVNCGSVSVESRSWGSLKVLYRE